MNSGLHKLFQSVMNINNQNQQQDNQEQQQQQQQQTESNTSPILNSTVPTTAATNNNDDENNVMRFFTKLTPPPVPTSNQSPLNEQSQSSPSINTEVTPSKKPLKSSIGGGVLPNLSFEQSNTTTSHNGVYLNGELITIDESSSMKHSSDLESQTITIIPSTLKYLWGRLISVNNNYICYAVKGEKIRVLERSSSQKALIKDISGTITDMQFYNDQSNLLACATDNGTLYVYDIVSGPSTAGAITTQLCVNTNIVAPGTTPQTMLKVCWCGPTRIVVGGSGLSSLYIVDFGSSQQQPSILSVAIQAGTGIHALAYNQTDQTLAYGGSNGSVGLINLLTTSLKSSTTSLAEGQEINFVSFVGAQNDHLIVGSRGNREVIIAKIDGGYKVVQKVSILNGEQQPCLLYSVDQYLFIVHTGCSRGYVLHFEQQQTDSAPHFDYVTEFDVKKPVLSYTVKSITSTPVARSTMHRGEERKEKKFTIYSVQSHAILFHSIQLSQFYLESDNYNDKDGQTITQQQNNIVETPITTTSSPPLQPPPPPPSEDDILELLTPGKLLVNIPSSPPPVSLPDPTKDLKDLLSSISPPPTTSSSNNNIPDTIVEDGGDKSSTSSPASNNNKKKKTPKSQLSKPSSETLLPSPKTESDSPNTTTENEQPQLLSPASLTQTTSTSTTTTITTTSPTVSTKKQNGTAQPQPTIKKESSSPSITTPPTSTTPAKKSKTPSFRPAPLQIPTVNPPSSSGGSSLSLTNQSTQQQVSPAPSVSTTSPSTITSTPPSTTTPTSTNTPPPSTTTPTSTSSSTSSVIDTASILNSIEKLITSKSTNVVNNPPSSSSTSTIDEQMIGNLIQTAIKSNLEKMVKKEVVPVLYSLEKSLGSTFEQLVSKIVQDSIKKIGNKSETILKSSLDGLNSQLKSSSVTEAIESTIKQQVEAVFLDYFGQVLVPGFEKSCMTMFKHLSVLFERGLAESTQQFQLALQAQQLANQMALTEQLNKQKESSESLLNGLLQLNQQMQRDMKQLMYQQMELQQQLLQQQQQPHPHPFSTMMTSPLQQQQQSNLLNHLYNNTTSPQSIPSSSSSSSSFPQQQLLQPQPQPQQFSPPLKPISSLIYPELKIFLESGDYSSAFNFALNASNLTMVVDLCSVLEPTEVYARKNLQNPTIISLIQQLSFDLNNESDLKLKWIKESIFQLDPNHTSIAEIVRKVLQPIKSKIENTPHLLAKEYYTLPILSALKIILK